MRSTVGWDSGQVTEWVAVVCKGLKPRPLCSRGPRKLSFALALKSAVRQSENSLCTDGPYCGDGFELSIIGIWVFRIMEHHPFEGDWSTCAGSAKTGCDNRVSSARMDRQKLSTAITRGASRGESRGPRG